MSSQIHLISLGKMTSEYKLLYEHYRKMIKPKLVEHELTCRKPLDKDQLKTEEALMINQILPKNTLIIALSPEGTHMSSESLAEYMIKKAEQGKSLTFIIGGAYGLDKTVIDKADLVLSLSKMTMPHLLAKLVLIEQIYRVQTIVAGHPYHK